MTNVQTELSVVENKKRIDFLDISKGIGIVFVLMGHTSGLFGRYNAPIAFSFHMPLFFIITGFCFHEKDKKSCFIDSCKRLLAPYFFTILLFIAYYVLRGNYDEAKKWIWGGVYGTGWDYSTPFYIKSVGGIWFFLALFWGKIMLNSIIHFPEQICLVIVCLLAYWGVFSYSIFVLPWSIQNGAIALLFLYIGVLVKKYNILSNTHWWCALFALIVWVMAIIKGYSVLIIAKCSLAIIHIITSCCGCYVVFTFAKYLTHFTPPKKIFTWLGRYTNILLSFHIFELHANISSKIALHLFNSNNVYLIFLIRFLWCCSFAFFIPKIPYIRRIYSIKK